MTAPNTLTPELVERYEKLAVRMDERGVMSATEAAQAFREAAAAIARLTAERDEWMEQAGRMQVHLTEEYERADAAEKSVKELELIRDSHSRDVVTALSECNAALAANKLLSERVVVLETALEPFWKFADATEFNSRRYLSDDTVWISEKGDMRAEITLGNLRRALAAREGK